MRLAPLVRISIAVAAATLGAAGLPSEAPAQDKQKNQLVAFEASGRWDARCIDLGATGRVRCYLDNTLVYKDRPDFRAQLYYVYLEKDGTPFFEIEYERQTSFGRTGAIEIDRGRQRFSLADCRRPCTIKGAGGAALVAALAGAKSAVIRFTDHGREAFAEEIELDGFTEGVRILRAMQVQHGRD